MFPSGLIKYGLVVHMFIDGFSRLVTGIGVHNNNKASTVLSLFLRAAGECGLPVRCRGDHGGENVGVAAHMDQERGLGHYIWGRFVIHVSYSSSMVY